MTVTYAHPASSSSCPGARFALQEARLALAALLLRFRFELPVGLDGKGEAAGVGGAGAKGHLRTRTGITLAPADGVRLRVFLREGR